MNLINLILIVLIITIEPSIRIVLNNALVFIKPENLTKTELVEKFKELSSSKSLNNLKNIKNEDKKDEDKISIKDFLKSYYFRLSTFILKFKKLFYKIALFTILMKYFRKIKIMRFIFRIINWFFLSTFGIFVSDIYGFWEIIAQIEYYWIQYFKFIHGSKIYKTLVKIFHVVIVENKSELVEDKTKIVENKSEYKIVENKSESKVINSELPSSERELKNEKIMNDKTSGGNEKENGFGINKYFYIGLSIISLSLIYIYWDSIIGLFKNIKPDEGSTSDGERAEEVFTTYEEEYKNYFKELSTNEELYDLDVIKSQQKGKVMDYIDVENTKWEDTEITPKASTSDLPKREGLIIPFPKK